jgi:hypothetical protein
MPIIIYLIISIIFADVYIAWMDTKKYERDGEHWQYGDWNRKYAIIFTVGVVAWPLLIPFVISYQLATLYFKKKAK